MKTMKTMTDARTFNTGTYGVEGIPLIDIDGVEHLGLPTGEMAKVEQAIALAALEDGCRDPEALRFARKAMGYTRASLAAAMDVALATVEACEDGREAAAPEMIGRLVDLLTERDRGGFVARRVTV